MATDYAIGDLVWYAPTTGVRFAGVICGEGAILNTMAVRLHLTYWIWKNRARQRQAGVECWQWWPGVECWPCAVACEHLTPRTETVDTVDGFDE